MIDSHLIRIIIESYGHITTMRTRNVEQSHNVQFLIIIIIAYFTNLNSATLGFARFTSLKI